MSCDALRKLRVNASRVRENLLTQKTKVRKHGVNADRAHGRPGGDLEDYLTRKLQRVSEEIERHLQSHLCQD